ncbi:MAG TPA: protein-L-isoaspartate(D-aspartate) O-methyltransferase [Pirellulales bacterium]|jgi:protein-L-isoaspartate(D-aspartate) O-methyltransferase|nr:protein-L-isoaspartate(D-aspartate) O-methyltransferase [Pirellulales bacterium]
MPESVNNSLSATRDRMVAKQLHDRGITSPAVLSAMGRVPRERFVPIEFLAESYADRALPIDCRQTISQPYIVAIMTQALELSGRESVLEIGTGSGYQTAILAELAAKVVSVERHAELSAEAGRVLSAIGYKNIQLIVGDGTLGWPAEAPYDRIIVTAAAAQLPQALFDQLREGGILVIPLGNAESQSLVAIGKVSGQPQATELSGCRFVPLVGANEPPGDDC